MKNKYKYNLEALRGFAAFVVVISHCLGFSKILNYSNRIGIWNYEFPGHLAVLIFFILSGYVIGLTVTRMTWGGIGIYLKKRFLRLYPIYLICILISLVITHNKYSLNEVLSNLFFLQRVSADPLYEIGMTWSLNYEVLFYLLFIPISIYGLKPAKILVISLIVALFFQYVIDFQLISMYGYGFCFWILGLWLSQTDWVSTVKPSRYILIGLLFMMLAFSSLNLAHEIMHYTLHLDYVHGAYSPTAIMFSDLSYLPIGLLMVTCFSDKQIRYSWVLTAFVIIIPLMFFAFKIYSSYKHAVNYDSEIIAYVFYLIGTILLIIDKTKPKLDNENNSLPKLMIATGGISYGIYLIHFIIIILVGKVKYFYGTPLTFSVRIFIVIIFTILMGYLLEKVWQPLVMKQVK